ncbi:MAG: hypothetical protein ACJ71T_04015 [Actinomycetales bacterium]
MTVPAASDQASRRRRDLPVPLLAVGVVVAAGLLWGVLWWLLAPTAGTVVQDGGVYLQGHDELMVGQDGWFVVLGAAAGAILATVWPALTRRRPVAGLLVGLGGCLVAGLVAWALGSWLGPDSLRSQLAAGVKAPVTPIALHTWAALLFAPFLFAVVRGVTELLSSAVAGMHTEPPPPATSTSPATRSSAAQGVHVQQRQ